MKLNGGSAQISEQEKQWELILCDCEGEYHMSHILSCNHGH